MINVTIKLGLLMFGNGWFSPVPESGHEFTILLLQPKMWCLRVSVAEVNHHDQKASWVRKGLFGLHFHHCWKSGQNSAGADLWAMRDAAH